MDPAAVNGSLTIANFNSTGGGVVTEIHLVLEGQLSVIQRHVALSITYDGLPHPSVFVPVGDFFGDQEDGLNAPFENAYFARRPTNSWFCYIPMPYKESIKIELVNRSPKPVKGYNYIYHDSKPWTAGTGAKTAAGFGPPLKCKKGGFCQDRLGTNTGKTPKELR